MMGSSGRDYSPTPSDNRYHGNRYHYKADTEAVILPETDKRAWYPGYDARIEQNGFRRCCNFFLLLLVLVLAGAAFLVGWYVIQPGVDSLRFNLGDCTLNEMRFVNWTRCNCGLVGSDCIAFYPCFSLSGSFSPQTTGQQAMNLSVSYSDYDTGCAFSSCDKNFKIGRQDVYYTAVKFYKRFGYDDSTLYVAMIQSELVPGGLIDTLNSTKVIDCYGDGEGHSVIDIINSSLWIGCGAIPTILFFIFLVLCLRCSTKGMLLMLSRWICCPCCCCKDRKQTCTYLCGACN